MNSYIHPSVYLSIIHLYNNLSFIRVSTQPSIHSRFQPLIQPFFQLSSLASVIHPFTYTSISPYIHPSNHLSVHPSIYASIIHHLSTCTYPVPYTHLSIRIPICPSIHLWIHFTNTSCCPSSIYPPTHISIHVSICPAVHLPIYPSIFPHALKESHLLILLNFHPLSICFLSFFICPHIIWLISFSCILLIFPFLSLFLPFW